MVSAVAAKGIPGDRSGLGSYAGGVSGRHHPGCRADTHPPSCRHPPGVLLTPQEGTTYLRTHREGVLTRKRDLRLFSDTEDGRIGRQEWAAMLGELARRSDAGWAELERRLRPA